eukprot:2163122-Prymnesium_polylepis.1
MQLVQDASSSEPPPGFVVVAADGLTDGGPGLRVSAAGVERDLALFRRGEQHWAIDADCPHQGAALEEGDIEDQGGSVCVSCPRHGWCFELSSGYCEDLQDYGLSAYDVVKLRDGRLCVSLAPRSQPDR